MPVPQSFVTHADVFPGLAHDFEEFKRVVGRLHRTDALLWCGRINLHLGYPIRRVPRDVQRALVDCFVEGEDLVRLRELARTRDGGVQVFFRGQVLELVRWIALLANASEDNGRSFEKASTRRDFVRALLMASDIWGRRVYPNDLSLDGGLSAARVRVLESLRRSHTENSCGPHPWLNLARGALVLERMTQMDPDLPDIFAKQVGMSLREYFSALAYFLLFGSGKALEDLKNPDVSGLLDLRALTPEQGPAGRICAAYLAAESQTPEELRRAFWGGATDAEEDRAASFDLNVLRAKPILRVARARGVVIDQVFLAERATAGPLFHLVAVDCRRSNHWFARFGEAFEGYVRNTMQVAFPPPQGPLQRLFPNARGEDRDKREVELTDAVLLDANDAVFFELKAVWLNERDPSTAQSPERYMAQVRRRYSTSEQSATKVQRVSGVGQLARSLRRLSSGEWQARDFALESVGALYPILLVHDAYLDAGLHSQFLALELTQDLLGNAVPASWDPIKLGNLVVRHLTVLTIDDWELVAGSLGAFSFGDCLRDYDTTCPDRLTSFRDFLLTSKYQPKLRYGLQLTQERDRLVDRAVASLFPKD